MKGSFVLPAICVAALAIICTLWIIGSVFISPVYLLGNLRAIAVYGRVLDQDALPVGDVEVYGGVLLNLGWERSGSRVYSTKTDEKGFFEFTGLHGERLGLKLQKPGYEYNPNLYLNWWNSYKPDRSNPAVFRVYKLKGAQRLIHKEFDCRIRYDGQTTVFDMLKGLQSDNGDLKITLIRNPLIVRRGVDRFDWNVKIEILGGSLVESVDPYPYEAPASGYSPALIYEQVRNSPTWTNRLTKTIYIRKRSGEYGRLLIDLNTDSEKAQGTGMSVEVFINPSGSRDLEFGPSLSANVAK
jgi:hypothetical protein